MYSNPSNSDWSIVSRIFLSHKKMKERTVNIHIKNSNAVHWHKHLVRGNSNSTTTSTRFSQHYVVYAREPASYSASGT